jgi:lipid-A-disaccharide synthase
MKYYIIAGEASGDLHASNLIKALKSQDKDADFRAWGGDLMKNAGAKIVKHYKSMAFMGFVEVIVHLRSIMQNFKFAKNDILEYQPDVLITVDFPGFNLRMDKWAHHQGIKVFHYISPNLWAWKKDRVYSMRKTIDKLFVILPFEPDFYQKYDMDVIYEGHPLLDAFHEFNGLSSEEFKQKHHLDKRPIMAILPGSRKQEISRLLPVMLKVADKNPQYQFLLAGAPSIDDSFYQKILKNTDNVHLVRNDTYQILTHAIAGLVCSGTATLEAAIFNLPQVVCYKMNPITFNLARFFVKIRRFSLVNLILVKDAVTELIQYQCTPKRLNKEFKAICPSGIKRESVLADYEQLHSMLGDKNVSDRIANRMIKILSNDE